MDESPLRALWARDATAIGFMSSFPAAAVTEVIAQSAIDFLIIDQEHGLVGHESMIGMLQVLSRTEVVPFVRVRSNDRALIGAALDAGSAGVVVPSVDSAAQALAAARACRYPPSGRRSYGQSRASLIKPRSPRETDESVFCMVMVESAEALECVDEIAACPGVDGILIGWADLSLSLGVPMSMQEPAIEAAFRGVIAACRRHEIIAGIGAPVDQIPRFANLGFRMVSVGSDYQTLRQGVTSAVTAARASLDET
jgi:4-hydroxy-2-oxoheptanedioate aldolase